MALLTIVLIGCKNEQRIDIRDYYFPINELEGGEVYEFTSVNNNSLAPEYWYYKTLIKDTVTYLTGTYYDAQMTIRQVFEEEIVNNGSIMYQYFLYETDSTGLQQPIDVKIEVPNVMPFQVRDTLGIFLFKLSWKNLVPSTKDSTVFIDRTTTLVRNRRYKGKQSFTIMGKQMECVVFETKEIIETEEDGFQELEINGEERYAKGLGLVYYRKEINPKLSLEYQLNNRYPMRELVRRFEQMNENDKDESN